MKVNKIHFLNCGTLKPWKMTMVCRVLLLETSEGLVLVDTGLGLQDVKNPAQRLEKKLRLAIKPILDENETAYHQILRLGLNPDDVKTILVTHLHPDHIGGVTDFPAAELIVAKKEFENFFRSKTSDLQISKNYNWKPISFGGEKWNEFPISHFNEVISFVELAGHTKGQCGVLIEYQEQKLFFCADAYYSRISITEGRKNAPFLIKATEYILAQNYENYMKTQKKLMEIHRKNPDLIMLCSHDATEKLDNFRS